MYREAEEIKKIVMDGYGKAVMQKTSCCSANSCCGGTAQAIKAGSNFLVVGRPILKPKTLNRRSEKHWRTKERIWRRTLIH